jgi:hypothetical protein
MQAAARLTLAKGAVGVAPANVTPPWVRTTKRGAPPPGGRSTDRLAPWP